GAVRRRHGGRLLDPYRSVIDGLAEGVWKAVVIWRELQARGYPGEISIIRDYLRPKRALRPDARATVRFETEPGQRGVRSEVRPRAYECRSRASLLGVRYHRHKSDEDTAVNLLSTGSFGSGRVIHASAGYLIDVTMERNYRGVQPIAS